jgi:hypothetical protein
MVDPVVYRMFHPVSKENSHYRAPEAAANAAAALVAVSDTSLIVEESVSDRLRVQQAVHGREENTVAPVALDSEDKTLIADVFAELMQDTFNDPDVYQVSHKLCY